MQRVRIMVDGGHLDTTVSDEDALTLIEQVHNVWNEVEGTKLILVVNSIETPATVTTHVLVSRISMISVLPIAEPKEQ